MKSFNKLIYWYAVIALTVPNVALCFTEHLSAWAALANIVLPFGVYMALMSICRKPGKMVWWLFPIIFFAAFQIVLLYLFGKGVIAVDMFLNLVTTNPGEAMELLDNLIPGVASVFILYLPLLILGVVSIRSKKASVLSSSLRKRYALWASALVIVGCIFVATACLSHPSDNTQLDDHHAPHYSVVNDLYPVNVFYNLYLAVKRNNASIHYKEASARFRFDARPSHPEDSCEVYVMVIGETARAMNFSLYGYQRDTNPLLSKQEGLKVYQANACATYTTAGTKAILEPIDSGDLYELLPNFAFRTGVDVSWRTYNWGEPPIHIDEYLTDQELSKLYPDVDRRYDGLLFTGLRERIMSSKKDKVLIILHTSTSHGPRYVDKYPKEFEVYKPVANSIEEGEKHINLLVNAYDNTIRYTDYLLDNLIQTLRQMDNWKSAMIFISDHGESLGENKMFMHGLPMKLAPKVQYEIPFLVWTSDGFRTYKPAGPLPAVLDQHFVFHSVLNLLSIQSPAYNKEFDVFE